MTWRDRDVTASRTHAAEHLRDELGEDELGAVTSEGIQPSRVPSARHSKAEHRDVASCSTGESNEIGGISSSPSGPSRGQLGGNSPPALPWTEKASRVLGTDGAPTDPSKRRLMGEAGEIGGISASPPNPYPFQLGSDGPPKESGHQTETAPRVLGTDGAPTDPPSKRRLMNEAGEIGVISASPLDPSPFQLGSDGPPWESARRTETESRVLGADGAPSDPPRKSCLMGGAEEIGGISASPPDPSQLQLGSNGPPRESARRTETVPRVLGADGAPTDPPRKSCLMGGAGEVGGISASPPNRPRSSSGKTARRRSRRVGRRRRWGS